MPLTPTDATLWIRSAATINKLALTSVCNELTAQLEEVETWPSSPAKGRMRDTLQRMQQAYKNLSDRSGEAVRFANVVLDMFGTGGVDPPQPPITWSTGNW